MGTPHGEEITSYDDYVGLLRSRMQQAHEAARKYLASSAKRNKDRYVMKAMVNKNERGDLVWYLAEARKVGEAQKLKPTYRGPVLVKRKVTKVDFVIQVDESGKEILIHHDQLKPYEDDQLPRWVTKA